MYADTLHATLSAAVAGLLVEAGATTPAPTITLLHPPSPEHGTWGSDVAFALARTLRLPPPVIANRLATAVAGTPGLAGVSTIGGYLNLRVDPAVTHTELAAVLSDPDGWGRVAPSPDSPRVLVEFVSANPTGPLHVGHARQAALGDTICRLLSATGAVVTREYYYNDAGGQITLLVESVQWRLAQLQGVQGPIEPRLYRGDYIWELAAAYAAAHPTDPWGEDATAVRTHTVASIRAEQTADLADFGIHFDHYALESDYVQGGAVADLVARWSEQTVSVPQSDADGTPLPPLTLPALYTTADKPGVLWLRTSALGDDKDRGVRKPDGTWTYFVPDVAYHQDKWSRHGGRAINIQGADHHGTVARVRAGLALAQAGTPPAWPEYVLHQMVQVVRDGVEVKASKRAGTGVTLRELLDDVGPDAARFFLLSRKATSDITFDLDLATATTNDNPVHYLRVTHARLHGILRNLGVEPTAVPTDPALLAPLTHPLEQALIETVLDYPLVVAHAARDLDPSRLIVYLGTLASRVQSWYSHPALAVRSAPEPRRTARLMLVRAAQVTLAQGLDLLHISAPARIQQRSDTTPEPPPRRPRTP